MNRQMPRSLALTLRVMRVRKGLTQAALAARLSSFNGLSLGAKAISTKPIQNAEQGVTCQYWLLERMASWAGMNSGLVFLISRIAADLRDAKIAQDSSKIEDVHALAEALRDIANVIETVAGAADSLPDAGLVVATTLQDYAREDPNDPTRPYVGSAQHARDTLNVRLLDLLLESTPHPYFR